MTKKNFYIVKWMVVWYRYEKLYEKEFDSWRDAQQEAKLHPHAQVLYKEVKVTEQNRR
jgi:hypothetical protein